jgi:phosphonate transport system substrate-binding protein
MSDSLVFGLAPTLGAHTSRQIEAAEPLRRYLAEQLGCDVRILVEESYSATIAGLRLGRIDAATLGELAYLHGHDGIDALLTPVDEDGTTAAYQSVIFTRDDTGITDLAGLRGERFGLVDEESASGFLIPRSMVREVGIDPDQDLEITLFGRHLAVVDAVLRGEVAAGGSHLRALRPEQEETVHSALRVLATSNPIQRGPVVVRSNLPAELRGSLLTALLRIHQAAPDAAAVLNIRDGRRFLPAVPRAAPTLKSIAALAGVSYATVSRVVNRSGYVAPATAGRVRAIVDELGYRPNGNALVLHGRRAPLVGFLLPHSPSERDLAVARTISARLTAAGVPLVYCPTGETLGDSQFPDLLRDGTFGALIALPQFQRDLALAEAARTGRMIVMLGSAVGIEPPDVERAADLIIAALGVSGGLRPHRTTDTRGVRRTRSSPDRRLSPRNAPPQPAESR